MKTPSLDVDLLLVVDVDHLWSICRRPSKNPQKPLPLPLGTWHLLGSTIIALETDGTLPQLSLLVPAKAGIVWRTVSMTDNSSSASIIYNAHAADTATSTHTPLTLGYVTLSHAVQPNPNRPDGLPPLHVSETFASARLDLATLRSNHVSIPVGVYLLAPNGQDQQLFGYFALSLLLLPASPAA